MEFPTDIRALDFGVTIALLIVVYRGLALASQLYAAKKIPPSVGLSCQQDPLHFQRIKEMHQATMDTEKQKLQGHFACQFKDREEVTKLIDTIGRNIDAIRELTLELRLTRNGNSDKPSGKR